VPVLYVDIFHHPLLPLFLLMPWLDASPLPGLIGGGSIYKSIHSVVQEAEKAVEEHERAGNAEKDFINIFLDSMDEKSGNPSSPLSPEQGKRTLCATMADFLIAGMDTTGRGKALSQHSSRGFI